LEINGSFLQDASVDPLYIPSKIGMMTELPAEFNNFEWYGRGSHETYSDRKEAGLIGLYTSSLEDLWFPYILPQESSNRTDTRWMKVSNSNGSTLFVTGTPTFDFSASKYDPTILDSKRHQYELPETGKVTLNIDYAQIGVGGDTSWGMAAKAHDDFLFKPGTTYNWTVIIKGIVP